MKKARLHTPIGDYIATVGGIGNMPIAPGTWGSLVALPMAWGAVAATGGRGILWAMVAVVAVLGVWAAHRYMAARMEASATDAHDPAAIVIDEVVGQWIVLLVVPLDILAYGVAFLLFRLFDIVKPWPVNVCDARVKGGLGVMADDWLAGLYALAAMLLLQAGFGLW